MDVSPLDLRQQRFQTAFRGFDKIEVTSFLAAVADDYEQALRETDRLKQELAKTEAGLKEHREHEKNLRATLTTAQKLSDEIKANADKEAGRIIREAEGRSAMLLEKAQARLEDIQREIDSLRLKRRDVATSIESTIQTLHATIEFVREKDARERDDDTLRTLTSRRSSGPVSPRKSAAALKAAPAAEPALAATTAAAAAAASADDGSVSPPAE